MPTLGIQVLWNPAKTSGFFNYLLKFTTDGPTGFHDMPLMTVLHVQSRARPASLRAVQQPRGFKFKLIDAVVF